MFLQLLCACGTKMGIVPTSVGRGLAGVCNSCQIYISLHFYLVDILYYHDSFLFQYGGHCCLAVLPATTRLEKMDKNGTTEKNTSTAFTDE